MSLLRRTSHVPLWIVYHAAAHSPSSLEEVDQALVDWVVAHGDDPWLQQALLDVDVTMLPVSVLPALSREVLTARGMGVEERAQLDRADQALVVRAPAFADAEHGPDAGLAAARALSELTGGVILDGQRGEILPLDSRYDPVRLDEHPVFRVALDVARGRGVARVTSRGAALLGLPEVQIPGAPPERIEAACQLVRFLLLFLDDRLRREPGGIPLTALRLPAGPIPCGIPLACRLIPGTPPVLQVRDGLPVLPTAGAQAPGRVS